MNRYFVEYGALQEYRNPNGSNPHRVIECTTSALEPVKIDEEFAYHIADALNTFDNPQREILAKEARDEAQRCRSMFMNCCFVGSETNELLMNHATLFRKLAAALVGEDEEDKLWKEIWESLLKTEKNKDAQKDSKET